MADLAKLRKDIVADGKFQKSDVELIRAAMFDEEGMTKEKGDFLFEIKDTIKKESLSRDFEKVFVEAISTLLLEDEVSPGEIDEAEAKWLRAKIQHNGHQDKVDRALLKNLRAKSINYPEILNYKTDLARGFENILFASRFLTLLAVIGSLLASVALFIRGTWVIFASIIEFAHNFTSTEESDVSILMEQAVSSVDIYLFATVLIIFAMGLYELFINKIDPVERKTDSRPSWLQISSIDDLKSSLGKVILMALIVSFFKYTINLGGSYASATDLLFMAMGIVLVALSLFIANKGHEKKHK